MADEYFTVMNNSAWEAGPKKKSHTTGKVLTGLKFFWAAFVLRIQSKEQLSVFGKVGKCWAVPAGEHQPPQQLETLFSYRSILRRAERCCPPHGDTAPVPTCSAATPVLFPALLGLLPPSQAGQQLSTTAIIFAWGHRFWNHSTQRCFLSPHPTAIVGLPCVGSWQQHCQPSALHSATFCSSLSTLESRNQCRNFAGISQGLLVRARLP